MKKYLKLLIVSLLATATTAWAAPGISESDSSAGVGPKVQRGKARSIPSESVIISVTPVILPLRDAADWSAKAMDAIQSPTAHTGLVWSNLWQMNPSGVLWYRIEVRSASGTDSVSISDLSVSTRSNDGGYLNVNGDTFAAYSTAAPGFKANGQKVEAGSEDVARFVVLYRPKMFNDTASSVQSWVNSFTNYAHSIDAAVGGKTASRSVSRADGLATVRIEYLVGPSGLQVKPVGVAGNSYTILEALTVDGPYYAVGTAAHDQTIIVPMGTGQRFYKASL